MKPDTFYHHRKDKSISLPPLQCVAAILTRRENNYISPTQKGHKTRRSQPHGLAPDYLYRYGRRIRYFLNTKSHITYVRLNTYNNTIHSLVNTFVQLFSSSSNEWWSPFPASAAVAAVVSRHSDPMASKSIAHGGLNISITWNALAKILRVTFAWAVNNVNADQTTSVSYWRVKNKKLTKGAAAAKKPFLFHTRQRSKRSCRQTVNGRRFVARWGEKNKRWTLETVGGGEQLKVTKRKKSTGTCTVMGELNIKHLCFVDCRVNYNNINNNNSQYELRYSQQLK